MEFELELYLRFIISIALALIYFLFQHRFVPSLVFYLFFFFFFFFYTFEFHIFSYLGFTYITYIAVKSEFLII